jgi:hypothetical protein
MSTKRMSLLEGLKRDEQEPSKELMQSFVKTGQLVARVEKAPIVESPAVPQEPEKVVKVATVEKAKLPVVAPRPSRLNPVALVPITVRLRPELAGTLKRASLERELAGEAVYTQQDIVEEALQAWFKKVGIA